MSNILLIKDSEEHFEDMIDMLNRNGHEIVLAQDKNALSGLAQSFLPDLILLDIMMPAINGIQLTKKMLSDSQMASIPVVFLSALSMESDELDVARELGIDNYYLASSPLTGMMDAGGLSQYILNLLGDQRLESTEHNELESTVVEVDYPAGGGIPDGVTLVLGNPEIDAWRLFRQMEPFLSMVVIILSMFIIYVLAYLAETTFSDLNRIGSGVMIALLGFGMVGTGIYLVQLYSARLARAALSANYKQNHQIFAEIEQTILHSLQEV